MPLSFMENENEVQETEETTDEAEVAEESAEETVDWKTKAEEAEKRAKDLEFKIARQREKNKELKAKTATEEKPSDFDYGQKAFLKSYGIDGADERELVKSFMARTGDDLDTVINDDILQAKLKSLRDAKVSKDAVPASTGRSVSTQGNKLDYWLAKYQSTGNLLEVPKELREDVLNARLASEDKKTMFGG